MKKVFSVFMSIILIMTVFSACSGKKSKGASFAMAVSATPESLDPQIVSSEVETLVCANCYEGLVRVGSDGSIVNGVSESYSVSSDGLTYTFLLRHDAKWHLLSGYDKFLGEDYEKTFDARVTSRDFVFAFQRAVNPETKSKNASTLFPIKNARKINSGKASPDTLGITAKDDYTLTIELEYADSSFLYSLTKAVAMPCNEAFWTATQGKYGLSVTYTICNGPFYLSAWNDDENVRIARNDDYKGETEVKPASVRFYVNNDESDVLSKVLNNTYDVAFLTESQLAGADTSLITTVPYENTVCSLIFNCADGYLSDVSLRKALCLSAKIDNNSLPVSISSLASGLVPSFCKYNQENYRVLAGKASLIGYSEKDAVSQFEKALGNIEADTIKFSVLCTEEYEQTVRTIIQSWQKTLGIKLVASVDVKEKEKLLSLVRSGEYEAAFYPLSAREQDVKEYLRSFSSNDDSNILNFSDKKYDSLLSSAIESSSVDGFLKAENYLLKNAVMFPVFNQNGYFVTGSNSSGIYFYSNEQSIYFISADKEA